MNALHSARHRRRTDRNRHGEFKCLTCRRREDLRNEEPPHCPVCGKPAYFSLDIDRFVHSDGSANTSCWVAITSGQDESAWLIPAATERNEMNDSAYPIENVASRLGCGTRKWRNEQTAHLSMTA